MTMITSKYNKGDQMEISKQDLAKKLLQTVSIDNLRNETRRNHEWLRVYHGFRPQYLTRAVFLQGASQFGTSVYLLNSLCTVFLDSTGSTPSDDLRQRFAEAAKLTYLEHSIHDLCQYLSTVSLVDLPTRTAISDGTKNVLLPEVVPSDDITTAISSETKQKEHISEPTEPSIENINQQPYDLPTCITQQVMLEWQAPKDNIQEIQQAVTLFERVLIAFVVRQLEALYGDGWLRKGCGQWRERWNEKSQHNKAVDPKTLIGFAELGEIKDIIIAKGNWPAFKLYFPSKEYIEKRMSSIISLRIGGAHGSQRELYFIEQVDALKSIVDFSSRFHKDTAEKIDELFRRVIQIQDEVPSESLMLSKIETNLGEIQTTKLVGREPEIHELEEFWKDKFATVLSITGEGGIGKTALLDEFIRRLLSRPYIQYERPDPEVVVYLTAKDNYLNFMQPAPESKKFRTLRRIYEVTFEIMGEERDQDNDIEQLRNDVLSLAKDARILFALDNLESLPKEEWEAVSRFISDLPIPSKAILTSREKRRYGRHLRIEGLPFQDAKNLLLSRLDRFIDNITIENSVAVDKLVKCTKGFPLALVCCANAIRNGHTIEDTISSLIGKGFLEMLRFSFESSITQLTPDALQVLYFLSLSKVSRSRKHILPLVRDNDQLDDVLNELDAMNLIKRSSEEKKQIQFFVDNPQLKDYVLKRAPEILPQGISATVRKHARVLLTSAVSPSVSIELHKSIQLAYEKSGVNWTDAINELETARKMWGEDPTLLANLGYYYFRNGNRMKARSLLEKAIAEGYETPDNYFHLALVYYYDHDIKQALSNAETALTLRAVFPRAHRLAGECLLERANREEFTLTNQARLSLLKESLEHLKKSLIADEINISDIEHNRVIHTVIARVEELIDTLNMSI
jgi:tetratricopeptide (TPR) repeat protein